MSNRKRAKLVVTAIVIAWAGVSVADDEPKKGCICNQIQVRIPAAGATVLPALGPDAVAGGSVWPGLFNTEDGRSLGPLNSNPANATWPNDFFIPNMRGEHWAFGYAFEVLATVQGDPALCIPNQLIKSTRTYRAPKLACEREEGVWDAATGVCTVDKSWKGTRLDLDADGRFLDVSTQFNCTLARGTWEGNQCRLTAPVDARGYLPDMLPLPNQSLSRVGDKIIWYDVPKLLPVRDNGMTIKQQLVAYVRGTDKRFCYAKMTHDSQTKPGPDKEELIILETKTGQGSIPGVP